MATDTDGRRERGQARRELLLDAAVAVIASAGAGRLTHRAVASEADVSLASVTYHFPGISDLRQAAFGHAGSRIGLAFRALVEAHLDEPELIPELAADYSATLVDVRREDTIAVFEMILASSHDSSLQPVIGELDGYLANLLTPYVADRRTALNLGSSIQGLILSHLARGDSTDDGVLRDAVADLIRRFATSPH
ncbi:DNA-binding transcriptional regulator YbjK [Arthrobacter sp. GAS37]|uniref:TetR/AcrR family transcriptional regulator n=1 Tax=Arthrobacter sp. GAS37 TaxID=3156261 RepID=UPI00383391EB